MPNNNWLEDDVIKENEENQRLQDAEIKELRRCYKAVFNSEDKSLNIAGYAVLEDLAKMCRANETSFSSDIAIMARNEGKREVYLRIQSALTEE